MKNCVYFIFSAILLFNISALCEIDPYPNFNSNPTTQKDKKSDSKNKNNSSAAQRVNANITEPLVTRDFPKEVSQGIDIDPLIWKEFHGGDTTVIEYFLEFNRIAIQIINDMNLCPDDSEINIYSNSINDGFNRAHIVFLAQPLSVGTVKKSAVTELIKNDFGILDAVIYVNISDWEKSTLDQKKMLVIHELLHSSGFIDDNYFHSFQVMRLLQTYANYITLAR